MSIIWAISAIIIGLIFLVKSADWFVDGAAALAKIAGLSPLVIGIVIIGFGTSAPEMIVSVTAALNHNSGIALGNAYGSNIVNIGLILGISALIAPIPMPKKLISGELFILLVITLLCFLWLQDDYISRSEALVMLVLFFIITGGTIIRSRKNIPKNVVISEANPLVMPVKKALVYSVGGLVLLIIASRIMVWGAVSIAQALNISDLIIGLTIIAVGTSLPELASSIVAVRKNQTDMALGNIVGSNIFNALAVVGLSGLITPFAAEPEILTRDLVVMTIVTAVLFVMGLIRRRDHNAELKLAHGLILLIIYLLYTASLVLSVFLKG